MEFLFAMASFDWFNLDLRYTNMFHIFFMVPVIVTFNVHIAHKYLQLQPDDVVPDFAGKQKQKVVFALEKVGPAVMHGCFTIFLAVLPLVLAPSFLLVDMFKVWLIMILFATLHGLFFLPALLSIVGPLHSFEDTHEFEPVKSAAASGTMGGNPSKTHPEDQH